MKNISRETMNKVVVIIFAVFVFLGMTILTVTTDSKENSVQNKTINHKESKKENNKPVEKQIRICDGINIVSDCEYENIEYEVYKYYPAVAEQSHVETRTTYTREITGYCTLCRDGTYSPSCATGRGACSHHGGVGEWNAPVYSDVPHYEEIKVVDAPAVAERYEKVVKAGS